MIAVRLLREGAIAREALFRELPVTLGRGEDCDFPIFDASVSRVHARLEKDANGALMLRDSGSRNGLHVGPVRVESVPIDGLLHCLVGTAEIEIEPLRDAITQEIRLHDWRMLERRRGSRDIFRYTLLGVLGWLAAVVVEPSFWSPWQTGRGTSLLGHALGALLALPLAGAVLLVLLKAFGRRLRLADTLETLSRLAWLSPLAGLAGSLAYYPLSAEAFASVRGLLALAVAAWATASVAAVRRRGPSRLFRAGWMFAAITIAAGFGAVAGLSSERAGQPQLDFYVQMPLGNYAGRSESLDAYFTRLSETAQQAAAEAAAQRAKQDR